jgi:excisionase family DNA binding protein
VVPKRGSIKGPVTVMTVLEVCEYLRVSRQTLYRMLRRGDIPAFRIGADWRFNIEAIDRWRLQQENLGKLVGSSFGVSQSFATPVARR